MRIFPWFKRKPPAASWKSSPDHAGWWVSFERGRGFDILYWAGDEDPTFEVNRSPRTKYFGPFSLPL